MTGLPRVLLLSWVAWLAVAAVADADDWQLIGSERGIEIFRREVPGSGVIALKGKGTVEAPLWKVASILLDTRRAPQWVDSLEESRVLRRLGVNHYIEYNHVHGPLVIKDRDFVSDVIIDVDPLAKAFALLYKPTDDPNVPIAHRVRGEIVSGTFRAISLEKDKRTELTAELHCDPKGSIPKWVVNFFQKNWPRNTFEAIRAQAAKPDISMPDEFSDVLAPTRGF
jgi:hypothetical protein